MSRTKNLSIAAVQPSCIGYDVAHNAVVHAELVRASGTRVVVFPELSITGYELDAPVVDPLDPRLDPIIEACRDSNAIGLVGAPTKSETGDHISMLRVQGDGVTIAYRKLWLSTTEAERFKPGQQPVVIEVDGWRLGLAICKDTGVVEHSELTAKVGMDVYVASVLDSTAESSIQEERALRITANQKVWVVVASFAGSTGGGYLHAAARSRIWAPDGSLVACAGDNTGGISRASLNRDF